MTGVSRPPTWEGTSSDPNDEQFGHVVEPTTLAEANEYDAVLVGEPTDVAVIGRKGASEGPAALRSEFARTKTHHLANGPVGSVGDLGDVDIPENADAATVQNSVETVAREVYDSGARPVFLGGDNSLTYPNAVPLLDDGSLGIVSFDAHFDCREVVDGPSSGTPYRQLFDAGLDAFCVVGARHFENTTAYADYVDERGVVVTAEDVGIDPTTAARTALDAVRDVDRVYVSVDLDVLDAPAAPGVSAPTPAGVTTRELYRILRQVTSDARVAGCEVVECAPSLDVDRRTATAGARAIAHALSALTGVSAA